MGVATVDLTDDDIAFLTCSAGLDAEQLAALIAAERLAHALDLPVALLYGLAREGLPLVLSALLNRTPEERASAFDKALAEHIIPASLRAQRTALLTSLEAALFRAYAEQPVAPDKPSFDALFATVLASPASRDQPRAPARASRLRRGALGKARSRPRLQRRCAGARVHLDSRHDHRQPPSFDRGAPGGTPGGTISVARDLATLSAAGWSALIDRAGVPSDAPGSDADDKARRYMEAVQARVEEAFPSAFFAAKLVGEERSEERELAQFLKSNPDFDLGTSRLDEYLAGAGAGAASGISDLPGLTLLLGQTQRIFKLTPRYNEARSPRRRAHLGAARGPDGA